MSYQFIPAGAQPGMLSTNEVWIAVKWGKHGGYRFEKRTGFIKETGMPWTYFRLPDRELWLWPARYGSLSPASGRLPVPGKSWTSWDELHLMSMYARNTPMRNFIDSTLISAHYGQGPWVTPTWNQAEYTIFGDSGGAQLKSNVAKFIDPYATADFYNRACHVGVEVDLPPRPADMGNPKMVHECAVMQRRNTEILLGERWGNWKLLHCVHGYDAYQQRDYIETIGRFDHPAYGGFAVSPEHPDSFNSNLRGAIMAHKDYGAPWVHLFGIGGKLLVPVLAWLGKFIPRLTSDHTNYITALRERNAVFMDLRGDIQLLRLGRKAATDPSQALPIPASNPIANVIGYMCVLQDEAFGPSLTLLHNVYTYAQQASLWNSIARSWSVEEYANALQWSFPSEVSAQDMMHSVRYISECYEYGIKETDEDWGSDGRAVARKVLQEKPLFQVGSAPQEELKGMLNLARLPSLEDVLVNYKQWYAGFSTDPLQEYHSVIRRHENSQPGQSENCHKWPNSTS